MYCLRYIYWTVNVKHMALSHFCRFMSRKGAWPAQIASTVTPSRTVYQTWCEWLSVHIHGPTDQISAFGRTWDWLKKNCYYVGGSCSTRSKMVKHESTLFRTKWKQAGKKLMSMTIETPLIILQLLADICLRACGLCIQLNIPDSMRESMFNLRRARVWSLQ